MIKQGKRIWRIASYLLLTTGCFFILLCVLAFTTLPFWAYYSLGTKNSRIQEPPATIVMLSGAGIPSGDGLLRTYYTARLARANPAARVIISVPGDTADSMSAPRLVAAEMMMRGVPRQSIQFENTGRNTREQAQKLASTLTTEQLIQPLTIVTSPEHNRRAVLAFRKCGFREVSGLPTFEIALEADLRFRDSDLKGNKMAPDIGNNLQVRYQFWTHLKYEVLIIREYFALSYYKIRGWI